MTLIAVAFALFVIAVLGGALWKARSDKRALCEMLAAMLASGGLLADAMESVIDARAKEPYCSCGVCTLIDHHSVDEDEDESGS